MSLDGLRSLSVSGTSPLVASPNLFCHLRSPMVHSLRPGTQFVLSEIQNICRQNGVATSKLTHYQPQSNSQNERYNGIVWEAIQILLHSTNCPLSNWECALPQALASIQTLINTVTKGSPMTSLVSNAAIH